MIRFYILSIIAFYSFSGFGQNITIKYKPVYYGKEIQIGDTLRNPKDSSKIVLKTLRFYVGNVELINKKELNNIQFSEYYLVDLSYPESMIIKFESEEISTYDLIRFNLGVDSLTNNSGALSGDLDPTNGMYWAWQSGYINFKIEGYKEMITKNSNNFQYHLGGFLSPFENSRTVQFDISKSIDITLELELKHFFEKAKEIGVKNIMSPCNNAKTLSKIIAQSFKVINEK